MKKSAHHEWQGRELQTARRLHGIFQRVAGDSGSMKKKFRIARRLGGHDRIRSYKTFENLFYKWKKRPRPKTLVRRWNPGTERKIPTRIIKAVEAYAIAAGCTLRHAHGMLGLPTSYITVFRASSLRKDIARLAKISRCMQRMEGESQRVLGKLKKELAA